MSLRSVILNDRRPTLHWIEGEIRLEPSGSAKPAANRPPRVFNKRGNPTIFPPAPPKAELDPDLGNCWATNAFAHGDCKPSLERECRADSIFSPAPGRLNDGNRRMSIVRRDATMRRLLKRREEELSQRAKLTLQSVPYRQTRIAYEAIPMVSYESVRALTEEDLTESDSTSGGDRSFEGKVKAHTGDSMEYVLDPVIDVDSEGTSAFIGRPRRKFDCRAAGYRHPRASFEFDEDLGDDTAIGPVGIRLWEAPTAGRIRIDPLFHTSCHAVELPGLAEDAMPCTTQEIVLRVGEELESESSGPGLDAGEERFETGMDTKEERFDAEEIGRLMSQKTLVDRGISKSMSAHPKMVQKATNTAPMKESLSNESDLQESESESSLSSETIEWPRMEDVLPRRMLHYGISSDSPYCGARHIHEKWAMGLRRHLKDTPVLERIKLRSVNGGSLPSTGKGNWDVTNPRGPNEARCLEARMTETSHSRKLLSSGNKRNVVPELNFQFKNTYVPTSVSKSVTDIAEGIIRSTMRSNS